MPPKVDIQRALAPFVAALKELAGRSIDAAVDTALEDVEERVEAVKQRISGARGKLKTKKKRVRSGDDAVVIEAEPVGRRRRSRD